MNVNDVFTYVTPETQYAPLSVFYLIPPVQIPNEFPT